jgi:integrase
MSLYKRGETWWYEFVFSGERIRESTKQGNKRIAEQMEAARRTQLAKGEVGIKDRVPAPTLAEYANKSFLPHIEANKKEKPGTIGFYRDRIKNLLAFDKLSGARLDEIDLPLIDRYISRRRALNLQVSTINRELATLRRMLRLVPDLRPDLTIPAPRVKLLKGENRRERVISPEEEKIYLAAAPPMLRNIATIILDGGFRPEEVYKLEWSFIRNGNIQNYKGKTPPARRSVPATDRVMKLLDAKFVSAENEWIFPAETKTGHAEQSSIRKQHTKVLEDTKLEPFVIYSLRHTCLTRWAEKGMNPYELMRRAGHSEFATTMRYIHMANPKAEDMKPEAEEVQGTTKSPHRADFTIIHGKHGSGSR